MKEKNMFIRTAKFAHSVLLLVFVLALALAFTSSDIAAQYGKQTAPPFNKQHQAGMRIGICSNSGYTPGENLPLDISILGDKFSDANFYIEGFLAFRLFKQMAAEISVGAVSRGEAVLQEGNTNYIGNVMAYPMLAKAKYYPLSSKSAKYYPYLLLGVGVYHVRHDIQFATGAAGSILPFLEEKSSTSLDFVVGGGIDKPLASVIGLDLNIQYMPIKQSKEVIGVDNWSSLTVTVGVKYLFDSENKSKDKRSRRTR